MKLQLLALVAVVTTTVAFPTSEIVKVHKRFQLDGCTLENPGEECMIVDVCIFSNIILPASITKGLADFPLGSRRLNYWRVCGKSYRPFTSSVHFAYDGIFSIGNRS